MRASVASRRALRPSITMGITDRAMMPSTTSSKFFFTTSIWPNTMPAPIIDTTQAMAPTTL